MRVFVGRIIGWIIFSAIFGAATRNFSFRLGEHAVLGYIGNKLAEFFGLSEQTVDALIWEWAFPVLAAAAAVWLWHRIFVGAIATSPAGSQKPAASGGKFCEIMEAIWWIAERSAWGRWQSAQRRAAGGTLSEETKLHTAEHMVRTTAENGDLTISGRIRNTAIYNPIDQHFWRLVFFDIQRDARTLWKASLKLRSEVTTPIPDYDSFIIKRAELESLPWASGLRIEWLIAKLWVRAKLRALTTAIKRVEPSHLLPIFAVIAFVGIAGVLGCLVWQHYRPSQSIAADYAPAPLVEASPVAAPPVVVKAEPPPVSVPRLKPHYEPEEIGRMLKMLGALRDIIDQKCAPAYSSAHSALQSWRRLLTEEGPKGLSVRLSDIRVSINDGWAESSKVINENQHFRDEIYPTIVDDKSAFGETANSLGELSNDLDELAKGPGINFERFLTARLQTYEAGLTKLGTWIGISTKRVSDKTKELREWKND
jgi:hypothetical protein